MQKYLKDTGLALFNRKQYLQSIFDKYSDVLTEREDLLGDGHADMSGLFYLLNRHFLYRLDNRVEVSVRKKDVLFGRRFYPLLKLIGPLILGCKQVYENRHFLNSKDIKDKNREDTVTLPDKPVIFVANHGIYDDVLATILAANRHACIYWGSLPVFYNTFDGFASALLGEVMVNRKSKSSRRASIGKALKIMEYGADLIIFPEGVWNKTSERLTLDLWKGVYVLSKAGNYDVVPIIHYVKDAEIVRKDNILHTVVDKPIPLYEMEEQEALTHLRDTMTSWQYKMAELYGQTTRAEEMKGFVTSDDRWEHLVRTRTEPVKRYDSAIEQSADFRNKAIIRPEDVWESVANIQNITQGNVREVLHAREEVEKRRRGDFQRRF